MSDQINSKSPDLRKKTDGIINMSKTIESTGIEANLVMVQKLVNTQKWQNYIDKKIFDAQQLHVNLTDNNTYKAVIANTIRRNLHGSCTDKFILREREYIDAGFKYSIAKCPALALPADP